LRKYQLNCFQLRIPFAERNFGPLGCILFGIFLFDWEYKTLFTVLFTSLYLRICVFYLRYFHFLVRLWANPNREYNFKTSKECDVCIIWLWKCQKSILKVKVHLHSWFLTSPGYGIPLLAKYSAWHARVSKIRYFD
jgi:hypothetical protein